VVHAVENVFPPNLLNPPFFNYFILRLLQASEKDTMPKDDQKDEDLKKEANGEKNGEKGVPVEPTESKQKLSLGEIAAIDAEISKAKTEQLQVLHNVRSR
jgi:hypothetical protein